MISYILHLIPLVLSIILMTKSIIVIHQLRNKKKEMYYLTRRQVSNFLIMLTTISVVYQSLQIVTYMKDLWIQSIEEIIRYSYEGILIISLLLILYKIKKK